MRGCLGCILCQKRLRLSSEVDECMPLPVADQLDDLVQNGLDHAQRLVLLRAPAADLLVTQVVEEGVYGGEQRGQVHQVPGAYTRPLFGST